MITDIDLDFLKEIYPYGLPYSPHSFFANRLVSNLPINYTRIRKFTKYRITNRGAWLRFIGKFDEHEGPDPEPSDTGFSRVRIAMIKTTYEGNPVTNLPDGAFACLDEDKLILAIQAAPGEPWNSEGLDPAVGKIEILVDGVPNTDIVVQNPDYDNKPWLPKKEENPSKQIMRSGQPVTLDITKLPPNRTVRITVTVNGVLSDKSDVIDVINLTRAVGTKPIILSVKDMYGGTILPYNCSLDVLVELPPGATPTSHDWVLSFSDPAWSKTAVRTMDTKESNPFDGREFLHFQVFPIEVLDGQATNFIVKGTSTVREALTSDPYPVQLSPSPNPDTVTLSVPAKSRWNAFPTIVMGKEGTPEEGTMIVGPESHDGEGLSSDPPPSKQPYNNYAPDFLVSRADGNRPSEYGRINLDPRGGELSFWSEDLSIISVSSGFPSERYLGYYVNGVWQPAYTQKRFYRFFVKAKASELNPYKETIMHVEDVASEVPPNRRAPKITQKIRVVKLYAVPYLASQDTWGSLPNDLYATSDSAFTIVRPLTASDKYEVKVMPNVAGDIRKLNPESRASVSPFGSLGFELQLPPEFDGKAFFGIGTNNDSFFLKLPGIKDIPNGTYTINWTMKPVAYVPEGVETSGSFTLSIVEHI